MKILVIAAAFLAVAIARPELYKEKEEFQYSRSSSDDGTKAGFYDSQRGNMGGNYERSRNMDLLAQQQMSKAVNNVHGELGDIDNQKLGSVFTAGSTMGKYNQRQIDLSNLNGRNFNEGTYGNTHLSSIGSNYGSNSGFGNSRLSESSSKSYNSHYEASKVLSEESALNTAQNQILNGQGSHAGYVYGNQAAYGSNSHTGYGASNGYNSNGFGTHSGYGALNNGYNGYNGGYGSNSNIKSSESAYQYEANRESVNAAPVKIVIRPGSTVNLPVTAEAQQYQNTHSSLNSDSSLHKDIEVFKDHVKNEGHTITPNTVDNSGKSYESSYKYHKEWEKHDTVPYTVVNPAPLSTHLNYEPVIPSYNSIVSSQSNEHSHHNAQDIKTSINSQNGAVSSHFDNLASQNGLNSYDAKPKSYESSYSYHKSWERKGDPYYIPVAIGDNAPEKLTSLQNQKSYGSNSNYHQSNSQYRQSHQSLATDEYCDCDNQNTRVVRSAGNFDDQQIQLNDADDTQQIQMQNLEDFSQHNSQIKDEDDTQQIQVQNLEDFSQHNSQIKDEDDTQQIQVQNLEDFSQHNSQIKDEDDTQQIQVQNLEDLSQHNSQINDEDDTQQIQVQNLEDFGQQQSFDLQEAQHADDLTQQLQNWDNVQFSQQLNDDNIEQTIDKRRESIKDFSQRSEGNVVNQNIILRPILEIPSDSHTIEKEFNNLSDDEVFLHHENQMFKSSFGNLPFPSYDPSIFETQTDIFNNFNDHDHSGNVNLQLSNLWDHINVLNKDKAVIRTVTSNNNDYLFHFGQTHFIHSIGENFNEYKSDDLKDSGVFRSLNREPSEKIEELLNNGNYFAPGDSTSRKEHTTDEIKKSLNNQRKKYSGRTKEDLENEIAQSNTHFTMNTDNLLIEPNDYQVDDAQASYKHEIDEPKSFKQNGDSMASTEKEPIIDIRNIFDP